MVSPATEAKLEQVRVLLNSINSKDFATDAKLEQARVLLNSINSKDFATNAKLEEVRALLNTINGKDFATQAELVAVKQELQAIKNSLTDGTQKVTLSGTNVTIDEAWIQDVTVTAGSNALVGQTGDLSSRRITFAAHERTQATHNFQVGYRPKVSGSTMSLINGAKMGNESTYYVNYVHFNVEAPRYYVYIKNNDTVDHTYNVYKYEFAN